MNEKPENKFISFVKRHRWKILTGFSFVAILSILIFYQVNKGAALKPATIATPTEIPAAPQSQVPTTQNENEAFFINQVTTNLTPVTGYSWGGDLLLYSTPTGIYKAGTNEVVFEKSIQKISWANNQNAIFKSDGNWFALIGGKNIVSVDASLLNPKIDDKGEVVIDGLGNKLTEYSVDGATKLEQVFTEPVENYFIGSENIVVSTTSKGVIHIHLLNRSLEEQQQKEFRKEYILSSVSSDGNTFALSLDNEFLISTFTDQITSINFLANSKLYSSFRSSNELIVVEQYKDTLGRTLENIHRASTNGNYVKISDSKPMKERINTSIPIMFNSSKFISTFAENNGKVWILSLMPNLFPTYSTSGELVFSKIEPNSH